MVGLFPFLQPWTAGVTSDDEGLQQGRVADTGTEYVPHIITCKASSPIMQMTIVNFICSCIEKAHKLLLL